MNGFTPAGRRILVVEDDDKIAAILIDFLHANGYTTSRCSDGLQVAPAVLDSFEDGAWFIELAPLSDPALIPSTATSLGSCSLSSAHS